MKTDTPRTDAAEYHLGFDNVERLNGVVDSGFARQLETELNEARAEIERQKCELSMADHHMYNQRKLIEKLAGAINDAVSNGGMNDYNDRILKEALRAAEGGE